MLYADKLNLETQLKLELVHIREKELDFITNNCFLMGTQAAVFASCAYAGVVETAMHADAHPIVSGAYVASIYMALIFEILCVMKTLMVGILGPRLALHGPEGSMDRAVTSMKEDYTKAFAALWKGLVFFLIASALYIWVNFHYLTALCVQVFMIFFLYYLYHDCNGIQKKFAYPGFMEITGMFTRSELTRARGGPGGSMSYRGTGRTSKTGRYSSAGGNTHRHLLEQHSTMTTHHVMTMSSSMAPMGRSQELEVAAPPHSRGLHRPFRRTSVRRPEIAGGGFRRSGGSRVSGARASGARASGGSRVSGARPEVEVMGPVPGIHIDPTLQAKIDFQEAQDRLYQAERDARKYEMRMKETEQSTKRRDRVSSVNLLSLGIE